jgi:hypothetical protein
VEIGWRVWAASENESWAFRMGLRDYFNDARRWVLRNLVPERVWPELVNCNGAVIRIRHTPYSFGVRRSICNDVYERPERELVSAHVKPGMQVLELGGSIGIVTAVIAHYVGPSGRVVSVEASRQLSGYSKTWLEDGKPVKVVSGFAFPVWELPADLRVDGFLGEKISLGGRVSFRFDQSMAGATAPAAPPSGREGSTPRNYDLSTLCREYELQPAVLVMDIESSEEVMLRQPPNMPACLKTIITELHPWMYANGVDDEQRILDVLAREGFVVKQHVGNTWLLQR